MDADPATRESARAGAAASAACTQVLRPTVRALSLCLGSRPTPAALREGQTRLARVAAVHGLRVLERPLLALAAHPLRDPQRGWQWALLLAVRGLGPLDAAAGVQSTRLFGGAYLTTEADGGLAALPACYAHLFGQELPARRLELTRPLLYHGVLAGSESDDPAALRLSVLVPVSLSLDPERASAARQQG